MHDLTTRVDGLVVRAAALREDPRRSAFDVLGYLIDSTPTISTLLRFAHDAAHDGRHNDSLVLVAIAADAIRDAHPGVIRDNDEVLELNKALRMFVE